jgi:hypothetical protein
MNNIDDIESINIDKQIFRNTSLKDFKIDESTLKSIWENFDKKSSPSRKVGDIFWSQLNWEEIPDLKIMDIGCGSGDYIKKIFEWSNKKSLSYHGFDLFQHRNWDPILSWSKEKNIDAKFTSVNIDDSDVESLIPKGTNFFMSQSALEHLKYDLKYFQGVKRYIEKNQFPITQIHLFPGSASLRLFLYHGYRQYGLNSIAKIIKVFNDEKIELVKLCGHSSNELHYNHITIPHFYERTNDLRETDTEKYDRLLFDAILSDSKEEIKSPCFWAMVIRSNV